MRLICADYETYFDNEFTLSKLSNENYIRDPRFEIHGIAVKWSKDHEARWYTRPEWKHVSAAEDWYDVFMIHHHANFDGLISRHHYGFEPKMFGDTMGMARLLLPAHKSVSLDNVRKEYGFPPKTTPYNLFRGKHWNELTPHEQTLVAEGACDEVESIFKLFGILLKDFPREELTVLSEVVKMFTSPLLGADVDLLAKVWEKEESEKAARLLDLGITAGDVLSADRFADLLRAEGLEPETKPGKNGPIPAFSKTDEFMRGLLEHDNPRIRTLAETRLGEKSTFLQTRAATLGWMARRGPLPVYLRYAGAGTLRVAGGDKCNWLNFKRNSDIRRSILAPKGFLLGPCDSSQIECRVLHYLAGGPDEPVIQKFRNREDPYVDLSSLFYKETIYKPKPDDPRKAEMEAKRGMGKQGRLMCCAVDTKVLTQRGWRPIQDVEIVDLVWDGVEWVQHRGLIYQGERTVENYSGVNLTSDHPILCGNENWLPAACLRNESTLCRALGSGSTNLPLQGMNWVREVDSQTLLLAVPVERLNIRLTQRTSLLGALLAAAVVLQNKLAITARNFLAMLMCVLIKTIDIDCYRELQPYIPDATNKQLIKTMPITAVEAFAFTKSGSRINGRFWPIWSLLRGGMIQNALSTGLRTIKVICREICALQRQNNKLTIGADFETFKKLLPTYDISYAGPRNRYTILSSRGPLLVHNCGYGASGKAFKITAKNGLYGPSVDISIDDANDFVALYRDTNPSICAKHTGYWAQASRVLARLAGGDPMQWGPLLVKNKRIYLPSGIALLYDTLEFHVPDDTEECREFERQGYWRVQVSKHAQGRRDKEGRVWKTLWGSKLVQNICEAVSRVIVSQAMIRCANMGYRALNWPYDELLFLIPDDGHAEEHLERCRQEMIRPVDWLPGLPLDADASLGQRYSK